MNTSILNKAAEFDKLVEPIERSINALNISSGDEEILTARYLSDKINKLARTWKHIVDEKFMEWLGEHGGALDVGPVRYYVGVNKKTSCCNIKETLTSLLECAYGDIDIVAGCLNATSFKHGTVHNVLGDDMYGDLFETKVEQDLKTGKAKRVLKVADREHLKTRIKW